MATTVEPRSSVESSATGSVFDEVSWEDYEAMLRIVGNRPVRVTYDQRIMEIMSPTYSHENIGYLLGRLIDVLTEELDIAMQGGGTATLRREALAKGAEPNQCYWMRDNALRMSGRKRLDLAVDPPPDLVIEVDVTSSSLPRPKIFAALGIPAVWRHDDVKLQFLLLQPDGSYQPSDLSRSFPYLSASEVDEFVSRGKAMNQTPWIKSFRAHVRDQMMPRAGDRP